MLKKRETTVTVLCDVCNTNTIKLTIKSKKTKVSTKLKKEGWITIGCEHRCPMCGIAIQNRKKAASAKRTRRALRVYWMRKHPSDPDVEDVAEQIGVPVGEVADLYSRGDTLMHCRGIDPEDYAQAVDRILGLDDEMLYIFAKHQRCRECGRVSVAESRKDVYNCGRCPACEEEREASHKKLKRKRYNDDGSFCDVACPHCGYVISHLPFRGMHRWIGSSRTQSRCGNCGERIEW